MLKDLYTWVLSFAAVPYASWALFIIAFAESSFFPLPPDILLIAMCLGDPSNAFFYALLCSIGSVLGGVFGYGLGKFGGRPILLKMFSQDKIDGVENLYKRYDSWAIAIAGFTPIPYKIFTIAAGAFRIKLKTLVVVSVFTRSARFFLIAGLIYAFGEPIREFIDKYFNILSVVFVVLLLAGFWAMRFFSKSKKVVV